MCRTFWMNVCVKWAQNGVFLIFKRLNGAENAGIAIRRKILSDITDPNSVTELVITPDDPVGLYLSILKKLKIWDGDKMKGGNREDL